ncbi:bud emergence protein 1 [Phlyctochytrium bullatum]|nr:bud emergence protein 1 [Phlyctochytrium bullatum]
MAYAGSAGTRAYDRDTLYTQYGGPPIARSPSENSRYYSDATPSEPYRDDGRRALSPYDQRQPAFDYADDQSVSDYQPSSRGGGGGYQPQASPRQQFPPQPSYGGPSPSRSDRGYTFNDTGSSASSLTSPPPLTSASTVSSHLPPSQPYNRPPYPSPSNSVSPSPSRSATQTSHYSNGAVSPGGGLGSPHMRRNPSAGNPGPRGVPPGFKIENGALVPIVPRGSSHPNELFYQPPKKVIRATRDFQARMGTELSFHKGDFFYVVSETERFYEVVNPLEKSRGQVPKECFEGLEEMQARSIAQARAAGLTHADIVVHFIPGMDDAPTAGGPAGGGGQRLSNAGLGGGGPAPRGPPEIIKPNADGFYVPKGHQGLPPGAAPAAPSPVPSLGMPNNMAGGGRNASPGSPSIAASRQNASSPISPQQQRPGDNWGGGAPSPKPSQTRGLPAGMNPQTVVYADLTDTEMREDGRFYYAIEVERASGERSLIHRTFDDFWALQVAFMNHFPAEAGRRPNVPRIIPLIPAPPTQGNNPNAPPIKDHDLSPPAAKQRKQQLANYLLDVVRLPIHLVDSPQARRFFQPRQPVGDVFNLSDLDAALPASDPRSQLPSHTRQPSNGGAARPVTDMGGTMMDLIEGYNGPPRGPAGNDYPPHQGGPGGPAYDLAEYDPDVPHAFDPHYRHPEAPPPIPANEPVALKIKVDLGEEMLAFKVPDAFIAYHDLLDEVEDRMRAVGALQSYDPPLQGLSYKDEYGSLVPLRGDDDVGQLLRTMPQKLVLYPRY